MTVDENEPGVYGAGRTRGQRKRSLAPAASLLAIGLGLALCHPALGLREAPRATASGVVYIQPLGRQLPEEDVAMVVTALAEAYGVSVKLLPRRDLPKEAYYPPRQRYRADKLLDFLRPLLPGDGTRIIGLTAVDISTTKGRISDWGVLGLGDLDGRAGVISSFRCHRNCRSALQARQRLAKVAVHEMGHTLGLDHCPTAGCLMHDAEGKVTSTDFEYDLCQRCRQRLQAAGHALPEKPRFPWPMGTVGPY